MTQPCNGADVFCWQALVVIEVRFCCLGFVTEGLTTSAAIAGTAVNLLIALYRRKVVLLN